MTLIIEINIYDWIVIIASAYDKILIMMWQLKVLLDSIDTTIHISVSS
jgi:hypothetical protein